MLIFIYSNPKGLNNPRLFSLQTVSNSSLTIILPFDSSLLKHLYPSEDISHTFQK